MKPYNDGVIKAGLAEYLTFDVSAVTASKMLHPVELRTGQVAVKGMNIVGTAGGVQKSDNYYVKQSTYTTSHII